MFDKRGTGLSDPVAGPASLEDRMDDVRAVMDAAGSERAALFGLSEGGPMSVLFAATYPERTQALLLCGTYAYGGLDPAQQPAGERWAGIHGRVSALVEHWGEGLTIGVFAPSATTERDRITRGVFERSAASPHMAKTLIDNVLDVDVRDLLPSIRVPTLVLHRQDEFIPVENAHYLAEHIPGARLVVLPGMDHIPFYGDAEGYAEEIEEFLTGARHVPPSILTTVLFTDIVGSTVRAAKLGDAGWRDLAARHDELVRAELERHRGREVKTMGDGFLATFDGPARGIRCASAIRDAVRPLEIGVRAGLHTGECELVGDDVRGMAVNIGARIGALAKENEVLVSGTVKDLVVGSGIGFAARGTRELKGVPGEWRLFRGGQDRGAGERPAGARRARAPCRRSAGGSGDQTLAAPRAARHRLARELVVPGGSRQTQLGRAALTAHTSPRPLGMPITAGDREQVFHGVGFRTPQRGSKEPA